MLRAARVAVISIHALREEGDITALGLNTLGAIISIHALREEGDGLHSGGLLALLQFLSTPSARRATGNTAALSVTTIFLSTPSARRATYHPAAPHPDRPISIHALREEGDPRASFSRSF